MNNLTVKSLGNSGDCLVSGYASVFGFTDHHNDIVSKGAFSATSQGNKSIKFLWQHDAKTPIGRIEKAYEDSYGFKIEATITSGTEKGREAIDLVSKGIIKGLSIGFNVINSHINEKGLRVITELDLWEVSLVTFPANSKSEISNNNVIKSSLYKALKEAELQLIKINKRRQNVRHN